MNNEEREPSPYVGAEESPEAPVTARPLEEELQDAMERLGTENRGDALLAEFVARAEQLVDCDVEDYRRYKTQGAAWQQRREEQGIEIHDLARQVGVSTIDLWCLEGGLPPFTRSREEVAADLDAALSTS